MLGYYKNIGRGLYHSDFEGSDKYELENGFPNAVMLFNSVKDVTIWLNNNNNKG